MGDTCVDRDDEWSCSSNELSKQASKQASEVSFPRGALSPHFWESRFGARQEHAIQEKAGLSRASCYIGSAVVTAKIAIMVD